MSDQQPGLLRAVIYLLLLREAYPSEEKQDHHFIFFSVGFNIANEIPSSKGILEIFRSENERP